MDSLHSDEICHLIGVTEEKLAKYDVQQVNYARQHKYNGQIKCTIF